MLEKPESWEAWSLGCWYDKKLGSHEAMKLRSLTPYRFPAFCSELPDINC
jgi:hypothetical protein